VNEGAAGVDNAGGRGENAGSAVYRD
jgi:hypothetical protein